MRLLKLLIFLVSTISILYSQTKSYRGPIIDIHCHISLLDEVVKMSNRDSKPETLINMYNDERYKKAAAIVIAFPWEKEILSLKNDELINFCNSNKKFIPICSVHPMDVDFAIKELDRIYSKGIRILKLHSLAQGFDVSSENVNKIVKKASDLGMIILFDGWNPEDANMIMKIIKLANSNPKGKFIIAHMGGPKFNEMILMNVFSMYDWYKNNVWVDISAIGCIYQDNPYVEQIKWTIRKIGVDRVLFGSDYPVNTVQDAEKALASYGFTDDELNAIMFSNANNLLESVGAK